MKKKAAHKIGLSMLLIAALGVSQLVYPCAFASEETKTQDLQVPTELGIVQSTHAGMGPLIFHIQTAHGNYQAQKKIQALLHYLKNTYGIKTVFVEGSASKLDPKLLHFVPADAKLTLEIADSFAKKSLIKGVELFLMEEPTTGVYGIENLQAYVNNGKAFQSVLVNEEKSKIFLDDFNRQIEGLSAPYLNRHLKIFLKRFNDFETKKILSLSDWLAYLVMEAKEVLEVDFNNPKNQIDWPMFSRVYRIQRYQAVRDEESFTKERGEFLARTQSLANTETDRKVVGKIQRLLSLPFSKNPVTDTGVSYLLEKMLSFLPASFDFKAFPRVKQVFAKSVFESELNAASLSKEMAWLVEKISSRLTTDDSEENLLRLFKNYRLLQRLFALDLSPEEYKKIEAPMNRGVFRPKEILKQFQAADKDHKVDSTEISQTEMEKVEALYDLAVGFYQGARMRDRYMLRNVEAKLKEMNIDKAVVITGGFHAGAFRDFFEKSGYAYALIAPKFAHTEGRDAYIQSAFRKGLDFVFTSTWEEPFLSDPSLKKNPELMSQMESEALLDQTLEKVGLENAGEKEGLENNSLSGWAEEMHEDKTQGELSPEELRLAREVLDGMMTLHSMDKMRLHKDVREIAVTINEITGRDSRQIESPPFRNISN